MKRSVTAVLCAVLLFGTVVAAAAAEHEEHHPGAEPGSAAKTEMRGQMMPGMPEMMGTMMSGKGMMGTMPSTPSATLQMMGEVLSGRRMMDPAMMHHMANREFFLDRADALGLSGEQVTKLKALRAACRKDNIRTAAELKIARLDLDELLDGDWSLPAAEKLVRHIQKLEGDMQVRHLQALAEAKKVLTAEQRKKAEATEALEELF